MTDPTIYFYRTDAPFGAFSNFSRHPFRLYGETWPTTEHLFQAEKFTSEKDRDEVRQAKTPLKERCQRHFFLQLTPVCYE